MSPPATAASPSGNDADFISAKPPKKAGIAAKMPLQCADIFFPHDWQLTARPGPSADLRRKLMAVRLQWGHLIIGALPHLRIELIGHFKRERYSLCDEAVDYHFSLP